jgi:hypothetical protein
MAGGVIAFYQLGYGIAVFGVGPLTDSGVSLSRIFGFTAIIAAMMALLSLVVGRRNPPARDDVAGPIHPDTDIRDRAKTPRRLR